MWLPVSTILLRFIYTLSVARGDVLPSEGDCHFIYANLTRTPRLFSLLPVTGGRTSSWKNNWQVDWLTGWFRGMGDWLWRGIDWQTDQLIDGVNAWIRRSSDWSTLAIDWLHFCTDWLPACLSDLFILMMKNFRLLLYSDHSLSFARTNGSNNL